MNAAISKPLRIALAAIMGVGALFANEQLTQLRTGSLMSKAEAIIGRPLTPFSYAGVARRTNSSSLCLRRRRRLWRAGVWRTRLRRARGLWSARLCAWLLPSGGTLRRGIHAVPLIDLVRHESI